MALTIEKLKEMFNNMRSYPEHSYWLYKNKIYSEIEYQKILIEGDKNDKGN